MDLSRRCRRWLVYGLWLVLVSCTPQMRAVDFGPLPDLSRTQTKVDVSGLKYNLTFDASYPIGGFEEILAQRLREHLRSQGLIVAPAAEAAYAIRGEVVVNEHQKLNGWLAAEILGVAAGSVTTLLIAEGLALALVLPPLTAVAGLQLIGIGLLGPPIIAASLAAPERTFAKDFKATITLQDPAGNVLHNKTYDYFRSDCASLYQRGTRGGCKINRTMAQAIDVFFGVIATDLAFKISPF